AEPRVPQPRSFDLTRERWMLTLKFPPRWRRVPYAAFQERSNELQIRHRRLVVSPQETVVNSCPSAAADDPRRVLEQLLGRSNEPPRSVLELCDARRAVLDLQQAGIGRRQFREQVVDEL